jgi:hypothetical protein
VADGQGVLNRVAAPVRAAPSRSGWYGAVSVLPPGQQPIVLCSRRRRLVRRKGWVGLS